MSSFGLGGFIAANAGVIDLFGTAFSNSLIKSVYADSSVSNVNYLCFLGAGAPPRWQFDGFLASEQRIVNGQETDEYMPHSVVKNSAKNSDGYMTQYNGDNNDCCYETTDRPISYIDAQGENREIYMPRLWQATIPEWDGTKANYDEENPIYMSDLLQQAMFLRGFFWEADPGHLKGQSWIPQPDKTRKSISGVVADASLSRSTPCVIPSIVIKNSPSSPLGFRSDTAKISTVSTTNSMDQLLSSFIRNNSLVNKHGENRALMDAVIDDALAKFESASYKINTNSKSLFSDNKAVKNLIELVSQNDLLGAYSVAYEKYKQLEIACAEGFQGLLGETTLEKDSSGKYTKYSGVGLDYASFFAVAEVLINFGLTSSFTFFCGGGYAKAGTFTGYRAMSSQYDEHGVTNRQLSFMSHHKVARAYVTCINEFRKSISASAWKNTAIQYGAEFNRSPNQYSGGSDHAINANCTSVFSGAISNFLPVGNIYKTHVLDPEHANHGTYGVSAPTEIIGHGSQKLDAVAMNNSVYNILGLNSPHRDSYTCVKRNGDEIVMNVENPKSLSLGES